MLARKMYSFPRAAVTHYHKLGGLKQQKFFLSVLGSGSLKSRCPQGWFLLRVNLLHASGSGWRHLVFLGL